MRLDVNRQTSVFVGEFRGHLTQFLQVEVRFVSGSAPLVSLMVELCQRRLYFAAPKMLLEPLHQCGIGALEIGGRSALEPVSRDFHSNERRGHARLG
jgi:hypothetical protein